MATRQKHWFFIWCYIPPGSSYETDHITMALSHFPNGVKPILIG